LAEAAPSPRFEWLDWPDLLCIVALPLGKMRKGADIDDIGTLRFHEY
jgi:hypothetical protein